MAEKSRLDSERLDEYPKPLLEVKLGFPSQIDPRGSMGNLDNIYLGYFHSPLEIYRNLLNYLHHDLGFSFNRIGLECLSKLLDYYVY